MLDYNGSLYQGKAIRIAAGVMAIEAYGGECPSIGIADRYKQSVGYSPLASQYDLAADQTLEREVVTGVFVKSATTWYNSAFVAYTLYLGTGQHLTINRDQNPDLYQALSRGGGGMYGVVISLTSKAHVSHTGSRPQCCA